MLLITLMSCGSPEGETFPEFEVQAREALFAQQISLGGSLSPAEGASLGVTQLRIQEREVTAAADGSFSFSGLDRANGLLEVEAEGFYPVVVPVALLQPASVDGLTLDPIVLRPRVSGRTRFLFAGDTGFGRRFVDTDESTPLDAIPPDDPEALIQASDPKPGAEQTFAWVAPLLAGADQRILNFESPATVEPVSPHPTKDYVFFSLPQTLDAVVEAGFGYVSLGNNHLYDYLEQGVVDTLAAVEDAGLGHSGAGLTPEQAFTAYELDADGRPYSLWSATSVTGSMHEIEYVASETQGGAADLTDDDGVVESLRVAALGRTLIAQLHTGKEYSEAPSEYTATRFALAAEQADLVVGHHPHIAQGFDVRDGVLVAHSLGNFIFDQQRLETFLGLILEVELEGAAWSGAQATPIYLEDYRPRPMVGPLAARFLRRVMWSGRDYDAVVAPNNGRLQVSGDAGTRRVQERDLSLTVEIPEGGVAVLDLREHLDPAESLAFVRSDGDLEGALGRDLLLFGGFEDDDVDEDLLEASRWLLGSESRFACVSHAYRGVAGLCMTRGSTNDSDVVVTFRNRIRVEGDALDAPIKRLSVLAYVWSDAQVPVQLEATIRASEGEREFGEQVPIRALPDDQWRMHWSDLAMPPDTDDVTDRENNPRALQLQVRARPPEEGEGVVAVDEVAVISWQEASGLTAGLSVGTPHPWDFLRLRGAAGTYTLTLTARAPEWVPGD